MRSSDFFLASAGEVLPQRGHGLRPTTPALGPYDHAKLPGSMITIVAPTAAAPETAGLQDK
jgi:hypothetical protein